MEKIGVEIALQDIPESRLYDLASLAKCLVTAPLALQYLDLDIDRREQLGFVGKYAREEPLTARMLLSHQSGLPPWLPFSQDSNVAQLVTTFDKYGAHPLLRAGKVGTSTYSDLNFRSLAEILEKEQRLSYTELATKKGLSHQPWTHTRVYIEDGWSELSSEDFQRSDEKVRAPVFVPDGPDRATWEIAAKDGLSSYPARHPHLPHDANSRAGMLGHAGFAATKAQFEFCLSQWLTEGWPTLQAVPQAIADDGYTQWGLGLLRVMDGNGKYGDILLDLMLRQRLSPGVLVLEDDTCELSDPVPLNDAPGGYGQPTDWWMHTGFTGPMVFVHPASSTVLGLLMHKRGPQGELIDIDVRRARAYSMLRKLA